MLAATGKATPRGRGSLTRKAFTYSESLWNALEPTWIRLSGTRAGSAFTSAPWVRTWLEVYGDRYRPTGVIWRDEDGEAVATTLLPTERGRVGPFGVRRAYLNASGPLGALCEHNDVLAEPAHRGWVIEDLVRLLIEMGIDELRLVGLREKTAAEIGALWPTVPWSGFLSEAPYVSLDSIRRGGGDYLDSLSSNTRGQVRRSVRLYAERFGELSVDVARPGAESVLWFEEMVTLHERRWRHRGAAGAFSGDATRFHGLLLGHCIGGSAEGLRTTLLRVAFGDTTIGILYFLERAGRVNFYQCGLRYDDDARLKPGLVAHAQAIRHFLGEGAHEYDFLGGDPYPTRYKASLSTHKRLLAWQDLPAAKARIRLMGGLRRVLGPLTPS